MGILWKTAVTWMSHSRKSPVNSMMSTAPTVVRMGEYTRNSADFYAALENGGFHKFRTKKARYIRGLRLKSPFENEEEE